MQIRKEWLIDERNVLCKREKTRSSLWARTKSYVDVFMRQHKKAFNSQPGILPNFHAFPNRNNYYVAFESAEIVDKLIEVFDVTERYIYPLTQWAAVNTYLSLINVPPQQNCPL